MSERKSAARFEKDRIESEHKLEMLRANILELSYRFFDEVLSDLRYDESWETVVTGDSYFRVIETLDDPLDVSGALAFGGRLNMGAAQSRSSFEADFSPYAHVQGALYVSDSKEVAMLEKYGDEYGIKKVLELYKSRGNRQLYRVSPKLASSSMHVIELDAVLLDLSRICAIDDFMSVTADMNGMWRDLTVPAPIQLLASFLKKHSEDAVGIRFRSSVDPSRWNTSFYFRNYVEASKVFVAEAIDY